MLKTYIYTLSDPITLLVKYVGQTINPTVRMYNHTNPYTKSFDPKNIWLKELKEKKLKPIYTQIDCVQGNGNTQEKNWIIKYKNLGFHLLNSTKGGSGFTGTHSESARKKMSKIRIGKIHSEDSKIKRRLRNSYGIYEIKRDNILLGLYGSSILASNATGIERRTINYLAKKKKPGIYFNAKGVTVNIIKQAIKIPKE